MTIDLTDRYSTPHYMRSGIDWTIDRDLEPVRALMIHHAAGWYGPWLGTDATQGDEMKQLDALAADHAARFKIGPGYYYAGFPSGRLYAIGKYGTHRAHTKGKNPETVNWWNRESLAIVAFGDYQANSVPLGLWLAIEQGIEEIRGYTSEDLTIYGHREVPGDTGTTSCPGDNLMELIDNFRNPPDPLEEVKRNLRDAKRLITAAEELLEGD